MMWEIHYIMLILVLWKFTNANAMWNAMWSGIWIGGKPNQKGWKVYLESIILDLKYLSTVGYTASINNDVYHVTFSVMAGYCVWHACLIIILECWNAWNVLIQVVFIFSIIFRYPAMNIFKESMISHITITH